MTSDVPVQARFQAADGLLTLVLDNPKGNILDAAMIAALRRAIAQHAELPALRAVLFEGEGEHFSFGASVEEHLPDRVGDMLAAFHGLFRDLVALRKPLLAAVRGQCLGGGLELAAFCHRVFASPQAVLGQPEITLGVFAPVASFVLPRRVGQAHADDLLLTGRTVRGRRAWEMGLVDEISPDPGEAARAWVGEHLGHKSVAALGFAVQAARYEHDRAFLAHVEALEALYLEGLMRTRDAAEGIRAFLDRRQPAWSNA